MRKFILLLLMGILCLCAQTNAAVSLGGWNEGAPGTTHQVWDFTPGHIVPSIFGYTADPEIVSNPSPTRVAATISGGTWDNVTLITGSNGINVYLEIPNYENPNEYKEVWIDIGNNVATNIAVSATDGGSTTFQYVLLPGQGDAEFGIRITPNPYVEKISFVIPGTAVLDYIHADTICTPEPVTIMLLGLGAIALRRRK
jgi:hypothetical protein